MFVELNQSPTRGTAHEGCWTIAGSPEPRINEKIRAREVRVIGPNGDQLGIKPIPEALSLAREMDLDLVEVADKAKPPVCRIMDYGKYKYEAAQRAKESRKKASHITVKEMKYRPKIGVGDFETKTRKVEKFLQEGNKVKITIMFRGREVTHPELGKKILDDIAERVDDYATIENYPRLDGRNMTMVLGPDSKKAKARKAEAARREREREQSEAGPSDVAPADDVDPPSGETGTGDPDTPAPESEAATTP